MKDVRRVPFRLPELLAGIRQGDDIFVPEGEKDVERLEREKLVATCNPGGAEKWSDGLSKHFVGAKTVTIIQDDDDAGRRHAVQVRDSLRKVGVEAKIVKPCAGKDVSDMLDLKHDPAELVEVDDVGAVEAEFKSTVATKLLSEIEPKQVEWLWKPYLPVGKVVLLDGDPGAGKTHLMIKLCADVTRGLAMPMPDHQPGEVVLNAGPRKVVYLTAEDDLDDTMRPRLDSAGGDPSMFVVVLGRKLEDGSIAEITLEDIDKLEEAIAEHKPALVVLDPLVAFLNRDNNHSVETRPMMRKLRGLAERYRCTIVGVRHNRKADTRKAIMAGAGTIDLSGAARSVLLVVVDPDNPELRIMAHAKCSNAKLGESRSFEITDQGFAWVGTSELGADELVQGPGRPATQLEGAGIWLLKFLRDGKRPASDVYAEGNKAGHSKHTLQRASAEADVVKHQEGRIWWWE